MQLERQKPQVKAHVFTVSDNEAYERSMNTLADALGVTRAEVDTALKELNHDNKK
jgi:biotin operon repressor